MPLLLVAFVVAAAYFGLRRSEETLTVAGFEWERKVAVEAWRTVREQAWEGSVPSQARAVSRRQKRVPDRTVRSSGQSHAARWPNPGLRAGER